MRSVRFSAKRGPFGRKTFTRRTLGRQQPRRVRVATTGNCIRWKKSKSGAKRGEDRVSLFLTKRFILELHPLPHVVAKKQTSVHDMFPLYSNIAFQTTVEKECHAASGMPKTVVSLSSAPRSTPTSGTTAGKNTTKLGRAL